MHNPERKTVHDLYTDFISAFVCKIIVFTDLRFITTLLIGDPVIIYPDPHTIYTQPHTHTFRLHWYTACNIWNSLHTSLYIVISTVLCNSGEMLCQFFHHSHSSLGIYNIVVSTALLLRAGFLRRVTFFAGEKHALWSTVWRDVVILTDANSGRRAKSVTVGLEKKASNQYSCWLLI